MYGYAQGFPDPFYPEFPRGERAFHLSSWFSRNAINVPVYGYQHTGRMLRGPMKSKMIDYTNGLRVYTIRLDEEKDLYGQILEFARTQFLGRSSVTVHGGLDQLVMGHDEPGKKPKRTKLEGYYEILFLTGEITVSQGEPACVLRGALAGANGAVYGGKLVQARIRAPLELVIEELPGHFQKSRFLDESAAGSYLNVFKG